MKKRTCITLEMSLKPFFSTDSAAIQEVCERLFTQWLPLLKHTQTVGILLWASDGSEILEYTGNREQAFEWAKYIGGAERRTDWDHAADPDGLGLHTVHYAYTAKPAEMTYDVLAEIVQRLKQTGESMTGKPVRVGATFDPGPEFAQSDFKYRRHSEICVGESMGRKSMVCCYARLHAEGHAYAGFPNGIPEGTPFGTFFGRQCQHFMHDLGFDHIWLSNGFGFGTETWGITGALFDGEAFYPEKKDAVQKQILEFWRLFREECTYRVETRGTNLTVGVDFATDGVDYREIYAGNFDLLPPPNSPWAAMDGDFGLELAGYMSRIAELPPEQEFLFRFYVHDPWWMNSPWLDRYGRQPHDIYLPLAVARMNEKGEVGNSTHLGFLTVDNSLGEMPDVCPSEIIPHLLEAYQTEPDAPSPLVWVYPFNEYQSTDKLTKPFFEDWFMRGAINAGFPVSTVLSGSNFIHLAAEQPNMFRGSVITVPVPAADSPLETTVVQWARAGRRILLYGSLKEAGKALLEEIGVVNKTPLKGTLQVLSTRGGDQLRQGDRATFLSYDDLRTDGGVCEVVQADDAVEKLAVTNGAEKRAVVVRRGSMTWVRGSDCSRLPQEQLTYPLQNWMRYALKDYGFSITFTVENAETPLPVTMLHRFENAWWFSGYVPDTTTALHLRAPLGAPLFIGQEARMENGCAVYHEGRAWRAECRVFAEQENGVVSCREMAPVSYQKRRRILVTGLQNATVRVLPRTGFENRTELLLNAPYPYFVGDPMTVTAIDSDWGTVLQAENVTGMLIISDVYEQGEPIR